MLFLEKRQVVFLNSYEKNSLNHLLKEDGVHVIIRKAFNQILFSLVFTYVSRSTICHFLKDKSICRNWRW